MTKYIKCNQFNKNFKYILIATFFKFFNECLLGFNHNDSFEKVSLNKFLYDKLDNKKEFELSNYKLTRLFLNFVGIFIFSLFGRLYELKISGNKINQFFTINDYYFVQQNKIFQLKNDISYERKDNFLYKFKNYLAHNTSILLYFIISFFWVVQEILLIMFSAFLKDLDYWFFEILIVTIIFSNIFLVQVYNHQKLAIFINLLPCILKTIIIILNFFSGDDNLIYTEYIWWIPVGFICYLILITINAFINCTLKSFIDLKYTTASQLLIFYSIVGIVISSATCVIFTYVQCSDDNTPTIINKKVCKVVDSNNFSYFDNFIIYFNSFENEDSYGKFIRIFIIILDSITFFLREFFYILVINYLDPVNVTFCQPIFFILKKIFLVSNNLILDHEFFANESNYRPARFFMDISGDIICLIGFLIYLEIIEINICGLNYNLKKYISERGIENNFSNNDFTDTINLDEDEYSNSVSSELKSKSQV
jgi:hypothetical protein